MRIPVKGLVLCAAIALTAGSALAQPPGVSEKNGAWIAPDGKPLYTFAKDMSGASACIDRCPAAWPPLLAQAGAVNDKEWTTIPRPEGTRQWAYKGKPVYTYARDVAGEPASGVSASWPLAVR
jgi:predicted lipoprotein with Yx(FWY)xxD motif